MASGPIFPTFPRFRNAISLLNSIVSEKFPVVLTTVCRATAASPTSAPFSDVETTKLTTMLAVPTVEDTILVLQTCAFIFERATLLSLKAPQLLTALADTGLSEAQCKTFAEVWAAEGAGSIAAAKGRATTLGAPDILTGVDWQISLGVGSTAATAIKETTGVLEFAVSQEKPAPFGATTTTATDSFSVEFNRGELVEFLSKLDKIQQQIDSLSS